MPTLAGMTDRITALVELAHHRLGRAAFRFGSG
jgi:hypothetical protein